MFGPPKNFRPRPGIPTSPLSARNSLAESREGSQSGESLPAARARTSRSEPRERGFEPGCAQFQTPVQAAQSERVPLSMYPQKSKA